MGSIRDREKEILLGSITERSNLSHVFPVVLTVTGDGTRGRTPEP